MDSQYIEVLGVKVSVLAFDEAIRKLEAYVDSGAIHYIAVNSAQDIMIAQKDNTFREFVNQADLAIPDGVPLVWISKIHGHKMAERVAGTDLMMAMCGRSPITGHSHFFYGGKKEIPGLLEEILTRKFPGLRVAGRYSPPFRPLTKKEDEQVIEMINDSNADFLWVGLGTPKQHHWISNHLDRLDVSVVAGVGAAFDWNSGKMKRAPLWMRRNGLEWLHRLTHYPGPVWQRYAEYLPKFAFKAGLELVGLTLFNNGHKKRQPLKDLSH